MTTIKFTTNTTTLIETEETTLTFRFELSEPPPAGGLRVYLLGNVPQSLTQLDLFALSFTGGGVPQGDFDFSGFFFNITSQVATVTAPIFPDGIPEGQQTVVYTLQPDAAYTVDPSFSAVTVNFYDDPSQVPLPVNNPPVAVNDSYSTDAGQQLVVAMADGVLTNDTDAQLDPLTASVVEAPSNGTLSFNADGSFAYIPNADFSGTDSFTYLANDSKADSTPATVNITVNPPAIMPTISFTASPTTLVEANEDSIVLSFQLSEAPPEGGLEVTFDSGVERSLSEFNVFSAAFDGLQFLRANATSSAVTVRLLQQTATITLPLFKDEVAEDPKTFTYTLSPVPGYDFVPGEEAITFSIEDTVEPPVVSMSGSPTLLREDQGTVLELNFTTTGTIPSSGTTVVLEITDPLLLGTEISRPSNGGDNVGISVPGGSRTTITDENGNFVRLLQRVTITEANATLRLPVVDDIIEEMDTEYTLTLVEGEGYNLDATGVNSVTFTVSDGELPSPVPIIGVRATPGTLYESEQSILTVSFDAAGEIPEGGVTIFLDSNVARAIAEFDITGNARTGEVEGVTVTGGEIVGTDEDVSGFFFRMDEANASISVPVFSDDVTEGLETYTFTIVEGEAYNVRSSRPSVTFSIEDTVEPPVVSMSGSPTLLREDQGTVLELNFSTTGTIPSSGTTVVLEITNPSLLGTQISNPSNGGDNVGISIPGSSRTTITDENGNFVRLLQRVTITEANATLRLPVVDDIIEEMDTEYTLTLVEGEGYNLDATGVNSVTFTVSDGELPSPVPIIGVTATPETLIESEQTVLTVTLSAEGEIPEGGVTVFLDSNVARAIAEFDITGNARTGEVEGVTVTGGEIVGTDEDVSGFFFRMDEATATISVPVFEDNVDEGTEVLPFTLVDGEGYEVDPNNSGITVTIEDGLVSVVPPVVGLIASPVVSEADGPGLVLFFNAQGIIPEEGIVVSVGGDFRASAVAQGLQFRQVVESEGIEYLRFNGDTQAYEFRLTQGNSTVTIPVFDDIVEEADTTYTYELLAGETYTVDPAATTADVTYVDGVPGGVGPVVSISTEQTSLYEGDSLTVNFSVDGEIPAEGLQIFVLSPTRGALGEFVIFNPDGTPAVTFEGISGFPTPDGTGGGFFVTLTEPTASLTLQVFDDGPNEGVENITFNLVDGELYEVNPDASGINLTISEYPVVGFTASPVVSEADGPGLVLFFNVEGIIPEEGIVVSVGGELRASVLAESLLIRNRVQSEGIQYLRFNSTTQAYEFRLTQADSTITIPIFDDILEEADTTYSYELLASETYRVDPAAATATVTYVDGVPGGVGPVVSISTEQTLLYEGDTLTVNFSVDGEIPEGGLQVFVLSPTRGALGEFVIFNPDGTPAVTFEGIAGFPTSDGTGGGFFVTLTEPTASLTLQVFDDGPNEGVENITFNLVDGELYEVNPDASGINLTISDAPTSPIGTPGDDVIVGTLGNDSLFGGAGNDIIYAGGGDNYLFGGDGDDSLFGGNGNDALFGGNGNDQLFGGAGNDYLYGGPGDNLLDGGDGNDILYAGNGNNTLLGGAGDDIIYSGSGQNLINAGSGNDMIFLNGGQDTVAIAQGQGVDTINNFQVSLGQKIGLSGGLSFDQLTLTQSGMDTLIKTGDETLAVLKFVQSSSLNSSAFTVV
ncbi:Ig-like domain-containing protein [Nodularia chucula]|uniref:Ig-like domain-containing protein n=1 Tax=Nodularia chucula TaxID=3093667 RepID=UPI0039C62DF8